MGKNELLLPQLEFAWRNADVDVARGPVTMPSVLTALHPCPYLFRHGEQPLFDACGSQLSPLHAMPTAFTSN